MTTIFNDYHSFNALSISSIIMIDFTYSFLKELTNNNQYFYFYRLASMISSKWLSS